ncbi:uncharacterized protein BX664DRAFT_355117 [Halteromyces radiatus]|uniref:uncharacterized protein n=1 Tax=Halteromyces radiatus TaxID=101107 RepID=UPI00221EBB30|nr:uncharacterized protein BX664DRAFT_355117 [Halteromyces radiatus]KAI8099721.1 hypothetical protein BX664DRAFT_355117 [Halteromyces radiatus]
MSSEKKPRTVFSKIINDLIRSAAGQSAQNLPDQDLDKHVAELLTNEARIKQAKYKTEGIQAYRPIPEKSATPQLKPNKRFLMNIVKATDCHNQAVIRAAEENARAFQKRLGKQKRTNKRQYAQHDDGTPDQQENDTKRQRFQYSDSSSHSDLSESSNDDNDNISETNIDDNDIKEANSHMRYRGRGKIRNGTSMDKYFDEHYDPTKDVDSDQDIDSKKVKRKNKKSRHSKSSSKKKKKHRSEKKAKKDKK